MRLFKTMALFGMLASFVSIGCSGVRALPLGNLAHEVVFAQTGSDPYSLLLEVQYRRDGRGPVRRQYPSRGRHDRGDDAGAAVAAGIFGLILGGIIAAEAQRQQSATYCAQRFRSYDPQSMTYLGYDGLRHQCP